jgi:hypothetical protein
MAYEAKVTHHCQTTISLRYTEEIQNRREGDHVVFVNLGDHIAIIPVSKNPLKQLKGLLNYSRSKVVKCKRG